MTLSDYCSELMKQSFNDSTGVNFTPIAIMFYLRKNNYYFGKTSIDDLLKYIYRFYVDNIDLAKSNSNVIVNNIDHYFYTDLKTYLNEQLNIWMKNGSGVLLYDGEYILINDDFELLTEKDIIMLNKILDSLMMRNFKKIIEYDECIKNELSLLKYFTSNYESYTSLINNTRFINRAFEDLDYCVCCEETKKALLQPIHINLDEECYDADNSIIFCKEHAQLYFDGYFKFDTSGKIVILKKHNLLDKRMHLSMKVLKKRKKFIK